MLRSAWIILIINPATAPDLLEGYIANRPYKSYLKFLIHSQGVIRIYLSIVTSTITAVAGVALLAYVVCESSVWELPIATL